MSEPAASQTEVPARPVRVGIAVVEWRGRYLVGIRPETGPLPGYAEFPGGKCLTGESAAQCAIRECREETGLEVFAVDLLMHREFVYDHGPVDLQFWRCRPDPRKQDQVPEECQGYHWTSAAELKSLRFPPANQPLIEHLCQQ